MRTSPQSLDYQEADSRAGTGRIRRLTRRAMYVTLFSAIPLAVLQWTVGFDKIEGFQAVIAVICGLGVVGGLCTLKILSLAHKVDSMH